VSEPIRVLVTGDRAWWCHDLAEAVMARLLARYGPHLVIVHGAASGVDAAFDDAAFDAGVDREPHPAEWGKHGRAAGPIRNGEMVIAGAALCLAVHRKLATSKGTKDCVKQALAAGIPVWLIDDESGTPKRLESI
jgi:ABC-type sugar transport system substrate-binding protein